MNDKSKEILVQRYIQGDMPPDERAAFKERLKEDPELRALMEHYNLLVSDLQDLGLPRVPADLWQRRIRPTVEANLRREDTFWTRLRAFFHGFIPKAARPALAMLSFVVVIFAVTIFLQQQMFSIENEPYARALAQIEKIRKDYNSVLTVLLQETNNHTSGMSPELRQAYADGLQKVDDAIADAERIYSLYANDEDAIEGLIAAYDKKSEFLRNWLNVDAVMQ